MYKKLYTTVLLFVINISFSQELLKVDGTVLDATQIPIANLEVIINNSTGELEAQTYTDNNGYFQVYINTGKFHLQILDFDKNQLYQTFFRIKETTTLPIIVIDSEAIELNEIQVKGKKNMIKTTQEGIVLNVYGTALSEKGNAIDVLKFAPTVSTKNGIDVLGSSAYKIIFNGKELNLSQTAKLSFLQNLKSKNIKSIKIIDHPDSSSESTNNAIIKIESKIDNGFSAYFDTNISYNDFFGNSSNLDLFYGTNKFRAYTSIYNSFNKIKRNGNSQKIIDDFDYKTIENSTLNREERGFSLGADYYIDSQKTIGFLYDYVQDNDAKFKKNTYQNVSSLLYPDLNAIETHNEFEHRDKEHTFVLDYNQITDTLGSSFSGSLNYFYNSFKAPFAQRINTIYTTNSIESENSVSSIDSKNLFGAKLEWDKKFKKSALTTGVKYTHNHNRDDYKYFELNNGSYILNSDYSSLFYYTENEEVIYSTFKHSFKKSLLRIGGRLEYKKANYNTNNVTWNNDFLNFTPTILYQYNNIYFYATRKLSYPSYYDFNPTINKTNDTEYSSGNQSLKPVKQDIFQIGYTFKKRYSLTLRYLYSDSFIYTGEESYLNGATISKPQNGGILNYGIAVLSIPANPTEWWEISNKLTQTYNNFYIKEISNKHHEGWGLSVASYHTFYLPKDVIVSLDLDYNTKSYSLYTEQRNNFTVDFGLSTPLFKNAKLSLNIDDVFNTSKSGSAYNFNGIYFHSRTKNNSRSISLGFSYNFSGGRDIDEDYKQSDIEDEKANITR